ncbi:unnamed protein product [Hymenolepis diminuta]|nr:unnamed protein product [Hymenolepis diminuta]
MQDCSPSATCSFNGLSYTCQCPRFYTDGGAIDGKLPGRYCYHSFISGFSLGCLIIVPALIAALVVLFYYRRYQAQKAWITPSNDDSDSVELVSAQHPKYSA